MSDASTPPARLPRPQNLRSELQLLADAIRHDLRVGENFGAAFVRFTTKAFQPGEDVPCAASTLIEIFRDRREILDAVARVVDVALELQCGCAVLATEIVQLWDHPKTEHKLARLADEILTATALYQNDVARAFILDLARRLSLQRPELAGRLIDMVPDAASDPAASTVRLWLKCGAFLRSQNESVRFFWERHLRDPNRLQDWSRGCVRPSVAAVRTAPMDEDVRDMFRQALPEEVWKDTRPSAETKPVPVQPRSLPPQGVPGLSTPAIHAAVANHLRRARTGMALKQLGHGLPWNRIASGVVTLGALIWLMRGNKPDTATVAGTQPEPSQPVKAEDRPPPSIQKITPAPFQSVVKPTGSTPPNATKSAAEMAAKPQTRAMTVTTAAPMKPDKVTRLAPMPMTSSVGLLALPKAAFAARPLPPHTATPPPNTTAAPPAPSTSPNTGRHPPAPAEVVALPARINDYDRWLLVEFRKVSQRYPELVALQRSVVIGTWNPLALRLNGMQHVTADPERYATLVRWLVIDPPLLIETRRGVLGTWTNVVTPDECISLWEELLERHADHRADIGRAALEWLNRPGMAFSTSQRLRLQKIVTGELD
jgi:hypothetical protein